MLRQCRWNFSKSYSLICCAGLSFFLEGLNQQGTRSLQRPMWLWFSARRSGSNSRESTLLLGVWRWLVISMSNRHLVAPAWKVFALSPLLAQKLRSSWLTPLSGPELLEKQWLCLPWSTKIKAIKSLSFCHFPWSVMVCHLLWLLLWKV